MKTIFRLTALSLLVLFAGGKSQEVPHVVMKLECNTCHQIENWQTVHFEHKNSNFPFTGKHQNLICQDCHNIENFWETETGCTACHLDVHQGRLCPVCSDCHTPASWTIIDLSRAHANTTFPLIGKHARLDCATCHYSEIEGEFSLPQSECIICHKENYRSVQNPKHSAFGFSKRCEECHSMFSWQPAEFSQHEALFPIFSGEHAGEWDNCNICHFNSGNYSDFSCLNCHKHAKDKMDQGHREVVGYLYESAACYACHPNGSKGE